MKLENLLANIKNITGVARTFSFIGETLDDVHYRMEEVPVGLIVKDPNGAKYITGITELSRPGNEAAVLLHSTSGNNEAIEEASLDSDYLSQYTIIGYNSDKKVAERISSQALYENSSLESRRTEY